MRSLSLRTVILLSTAWAAAAAYFSLRLDPSLMSASGPGGGLVGIALTPALAVRMIGLCVLPPLIFIWAWRRARSRGATPVV